MLKKSIWPSKPQSKTVSQRNQERPDRFSFILRLIFKRKFYQRRSHSLRQKSELNFCRKAVFSVSYLPEGKTGSTFKDDRCLKAICSKILMQLRFLLQTLGNPKEFSDTNWQRQDNLQYPLIALREGVLNALIHQDFSNISGSTTVIIYSDKLEITNSWQSFTETCRIKEEPSFVAVKSWHRTNRFPARLHRKTRPGNFENSWRL